MFLLLILLVAGCELVGDAGLAHEPEFSSIVATPLSEAAWQIEAIIENQAGRTVYFSGCGPAINVYVQEVVDSQWGEKRAVMSPCLAIFAPEPMPVRHGASLHVRLYVSEVGVYRLHVPYSHFAVMDGHESIRFVVSEPFEI